METNELPRGKNILSEEDAFAISYERPSYKAVAFNYFLDLYRNKASLRPKSEVQESSLERIERKIDNLRQEVATRDDIIKQTELLLNQQKELNTELENKLEILRSMQEANVPHKRLAKLSLAFFVFFALSFLSDVILNVTIVTPSWNNVGLLCSFSFLMMAFLMSKDWADLINKED
jgi:hypothetical protein